MGKLILGLLILPFVQSLYAIEPERVPGEYLVKFSRSGDLAPLFQNKKEKLKFVLKRWIPNTTIAVLKIEDKGNTKATIENLMLSQGVEIVEPNYIYRTNRTPNDPHLSKLWGLSNTGQIDSGKSPGVSGMDIGAEKAWDIQTGSKDLIVAVIDTGVDYQHKDLADNIWTNVAEANGVLGVDDDGNGFIDDIHGYDFVNKDGDPMDDHGHGSHCSGTIGAKGDDGYGLAGVAWNVRIMAIKFLGKNGSGDLEDAVEGIRYAVKMGAKVLSNSWGGGGYSEILKGAIEEANAKNVIFTAAAGNSSNNNDESPTYPANYNIPNVISVAAINNRGNLAEFSSFGKRTVHVAAPGVNIYSSIPSGYDSWSGTSMATPHVTGVAALVLSQEPHLTPLEVKERLIKTSKPIARLKGKVASGGIIDAYFALTNQAAPADPNDPENWSESRPELISTAHPYSKNFSQTWEIEVAEANQIALYFSNFETELKYDKLSFYGRDGKKITEMSGAQGATWSPAIIGNYVKIIFTSDDSINKYGFDIERIGFR